MKLNNLLIFPKFPSIDVVKILDDNFGEINRLTQFILSLYGIKNIDLKDDIKN